MLRDPAFRWLCAANYVDAIGTWLERLAVGWFVLDTTGSVFLTALSFAARSAPNMFLGSLGGVVADRFSRTRVLSTTTAAKALLMCALAACGFLRLHSAWPVLTIVALSSVARASEQPSVQGILGDIGGPSGIARATSLHSTGARTVGRRMHGISSLTDTVPTFTNVDSSDTPPLPPHSVGGQMNPLTRWWASQDTSRRSAIGVGSLAVILLMVVAIFTIFRKSADPVVVEVAPVPTVSATSIVTLPEPSPTDVGVPTIRSLKELKERFGDPHR